MVDFVGVGINSTDTLIRLPRFPAFDSKVEVISSEILPGGQVATAAVACQRWGLKTRYVGKIGDDLAGRIQREELQREGLETHLIEVAHCSSQIAFILVDQSSGERTILWKRDSRLDLLPGELCAEWITRARLLHVDGHPSAPAALAAQWARQAGVMVIADLDNLYPGVEALLETCRLPDFLARVSRAPARNRGSPRVLAGDCQAIRLPRSRRDARTRGSARLGWRDDSTTARRSGSIPWIRPAPETSSTRGLHIVYLMVGRWRRLWSSVARRRRSTALPSARAAVSGRSARSQR